MDKLINRRFVMLLECNVCGVGIAEQCVSAVKRKNANILPLKINRPHKGRMRAINQCGVRRYGYIAYQGGPCVKATGHKDKIHIDNLGLSWQDAPYYVNKYGYVE